MTDSASTETITCTEHEVKEVAQANATGKQPVVFVHGLWLLPSSWDRWREVFEEAGYVTLAPGWPDDPDTVEEAKEHPEVFAHKSVGQIADHFDEVISALERKPAVLGHSFGGLLSQILAGRGLSAASVAIDPAPFRGVLPLPFSALKSASPVLRNPANRNRAVPLTYEQFRYAFANVVSEEEAKQLHETFAGGAAVPSCDGQYQPLDRGQGRDRERRARTAPDHLGREGSHRALGDRECLLQATGAQRGRDRDR
jgi:non-heme chloroperoxidase